MVDGSAQPDRPPQGWYVDPYGIHDHRWFSQGTPTALVRDGRTESQDPPPDRPYEGPLVTAAPPRAPDRPAEDRQRAGDRLGAPGLSPEEQFDFLGEPVLPGTVGTPTSDMDADGRVRSPWRSAGSGPPVRRSEAAGAPTGRTPGVRTAPERLLRVRWIALGGAVVWTFLVGMEVVFATTTVTTAPGRHHTETVGAADTVGVVAFLAFLIVLVTVAAVGLVRRARDGSERWSVPGAVGAGVLGALGVLSLATIGLALLLLAFLLFVVARPIRRPRPVIGERVVPPEGPPAPPD